MFRQAPSFPYHDLGIVEDGNTASRAISKDAYVIWKGASYFASADILQGATLEEDVNLTPIPDGVINGVVSALNNNLYYDYNNPTQITLSSGTQSYTAPFNGLFIVQLGSGDGTKPSIMVKNSSNVGMIVIQSNGSWVQATLPVKKGQTFSIEFSPYISSYNCYIVPTIASSSNS